MISIRLKNFDEPPYRLLDTISVSQIYNAANMRAGKKCTGIYREDTVRNTLKAYSIGEIDYLEHYTPKCYFCESAGEEMGVLDVEHYRPKDGLSLEDLENEEEHDGYYWLANEWSNLLLACRGCNGKKGTRFPINGPRFFHHQPVVNNILNRNQSVITSELLFNEDPLIINPEIDTPEEHLTFDSLGQILVKGESEMGEETIEILKLYRDPLYKARAKILNVFIADINTWVTYHSIGRINDATLQLNFFEICRKIVSRKRPNMAYTLWGRHINNEFNNIFSENVPNNIRPILNNAYIEALALENAGNNII